MAGESQLWSINKNSRNMIKSCLFCNKTYTFRGTKQKYCCRECSSNSKKGKKFTKEHKEKKQAC